MESESQQVVRYLSSLRLTIQDRIGVHMLANVSEARNMALKAKMMLQEKRTGFPQKNCYQHSSTEVKMS